MHIQLNENIIGVTFEEGVWDSILPIQPCIVDLLLTAFYGTIQSCTTFVAHAPFQV